jgi:deoxyribodipyrimidine photo-lyase
MDRNRALVWLRRAIRLDDNAPLSHALQNSGEVVPLLVLSPEPTYLLDTPRRRFVREAIAELDANLRERGTRLHVRIGLPEIELPRAAREYGAGTVVASRLYDAPGVRRDERIARALSEMGAGLSLVKDRVLLESQEVQTKDGNPYRVFTPYKNRWRELSENVSRPFPAIRRIEPVDFSPYSVQLDRVPGFALLGARSGEADAQDRLRAFVKSSVDSYASRRDIPGVDGTSRLSHHLALGTLSPRRVYRSLLDHLRESTAPVRNGSETFLSELIWREFYYQIMAEFPFVVNGSFKEEFRGMQWRRSRSAYERWKSGTTGYPIVDAAMRQLREEGWMHNRARMITASFLTKDLHLNWQWGERYFAEVLMDFDIAANNGGWQWTAGTGTDASPWFRIFNPVTQGKKFDGDGAYVRRYVPELRRVPATYIHEPWRMNQQDQEAYGCMIGKQYPSRIVDHAEARAATLLLYTKKPAGRDRP